MQVVCEKPLIIIVPKEDQCDRLDLHYYQPELIKIAHEINRLPCKTLLKELLEKDSPISSGATPKGANYKDEGIPFLRVQNIRPMELLLEDIVFIDCETHESIGRSKITRGDVLFTITGATFGYAAVFDAQEFTEANINQHIVRLRCNQEKIDPYFLALYLNSNLGYGQSRRNITGGSRPALDFGSIGNFLIPIVDMQKQELVICRYDIIKETYNTIKGLYRDVIKIISVRIGDQIDNYFATELQIQGFIAKTKDLAFLRDSYLMERLDVPANHPDYTRLVDQIKKSPAAGTIGNLVDVSENRFNPDENTGKMAHYLAIGDIDGISGKIIAPQTMLAEELPSRARRIIRKEDILVGIAGASTGTENMVVYPVSQEEDGWVATTGFEVLRPKPSVNIEYVCRLLKAPFVLRQIRAVLTSPSMPTISEEDLLNISVPVTDEKTRRQTLEMINKVISDEQELVSQLDAISKQIDQLLSQSKSNIFDLLDDSKYSAMSTKANELKEAMTRIEESLK